MNLTIQLDEQKRTAVEAWAKAHGETVEKLVEKFLEKLVTESDQTSKRAYQEMEKSFSRPLITDEIRRLQDEAGIKSVTDFDEREDFENHIKRKHA
ncbi:MAG: hypothetical protein BGO21_11075 [Dyadobacter sp. 50-39]|uniref:DUF6364 family protein n=1 Tax=Dyadobacter sp. 50-39 TaxID=1895756 RepID=UPI00096187A7|nr:DUF6364 family protein [Dyadobacter sp. 50-39]OJV21389.1 MAG: hypothetical protein BGO21_11075 [Dyadobacter sp. 50-39]